MTEEDEAFNEIEQRAKQRMEAVKAAMRGEDDDIQEYKKPWIGLTEEEIKFCWYKACQTNLELTSQLVVYFARAVENKSKEKNG